MSFYLLFKQDDRISRVNVKLPCSKETIQNSFFPQVDTMLLTIVLGVKGFFDELSRMPKEIPPPWADEFIW